MKEEMINEIMKQQTPVAELIRNSRAAISEAYDMIEDIDIPEEYKQIAFGKILDKDLDKYYRTYEEKTEE